MDTAGDDARDQARETVWSVVCVRCGALPGYPCVFPPDRPEPGDPLAVHLRRKAEYLRAVDPTPESPGDLAESVTAVVDVWCDPSLAGSGRRADTARSLATRLDALARAAGREVPQ